MACRNCSLTDRECAVWKRAGCCTACDHRASLTAEIEQRVDVYLTTGDAADLHRVRGQLLPDPATLVPPGLIPQWVRDWLFALAWDFEAHADRLVLSGDQSLDYAEGYRAAATRLRNLLSDNDSVSATNGRDL